jgi:hypothetical protein
MADVRMFGPWLRRGWEVRDWGLSRTLDGVQSHCITIMENGCIRMQMESFYPVYLMNSTVLAQLARLDALMPEAYEAQEGR